MGQSNENLTRQLGGAIPLEGVPDRIEIMPIGTFRTADGRGEFRLSDPKGVIERSMARANGGALMVDFAHGMHGRAERRSDAAGWITGLDVEADRVVASVEWTPAGREAIENKSYRFISPEFFNRPDREVVLIGSAGLVNDPALPILRQLASLEKDNPMDDLKQIAAKLGLSEDATLEDILTATEKSQKPADSDSEKQLASILKAAGVDELTAESAQQICARLAADPDPTSFVPKKAFDDLSRQLASLQKTVESGTVDAAVAAAKVKGKIPPALESWARQLAAKDMDAFQEYVKTAPAQVTPGRDDPPANNGDPVGADGLTELERQMCSAMGVDPEKFAETKKGDS